LTRELLFAVGLLKLCYIGSNSVMARIRLGLVTAKG